MLIGSIAGELRKVLPALLVLLLLSASAVLAQQSTAFTYQGRLQDSGTPANGVYDLQFTVFDTGGTQIGSPLVRSAVTVANGIFSVSLDFGANAFPGADRFLEIGVRPTGGGSFTILSPRQQITSTPYAIRSANATTADTATNAANATNATNATTATNAIQLGGIAAGQYVLMSDSRMTDARNPLPNSANYIQNTNSQQASSNFNISGNGTAGGTLTANALNATTSVGIGTTPTRARLETRGAIGNTVALFGGEGTGVALVRDYPFIGFNSYFNNGWKAISPGFGGHVGIEQDVGAMTFYVNPTVSSANAPVLPVEAMRITQGPDVWINQSPVGSASSLNVYSNHSNCDVVTIGYGAPVSRYCYSALMITTTGPAFDLIDGENNSVGVFRVTADGTVCAANIACSSDARLKRNVTPLAYGLREVLRLRPVRWQWKEATTNQLNLGLVAQEVQPVMPELILRNVDAKGTLGLNYMGLIPVLVKGIQEQQTQIVAQREQIVQQQLVIRRQQEQTKQEQAQLSRQQVQLDALKKLVCLSHPRARACK